MGARGVPQWPRSCGCPQGRRPPPCRPPPACDLDPGVWVPSSRSHLMSNWEHSGCKYSLIRPGSCSLSLLRSLRAPVKGDQGTAGSWGGWGGTPGCCWVLGAQHRPAPLRTDCFVQGGVSWTVGKLRQGWMWGDPVLGRPALSWCGSSGGVLGVLVASHTRWVHPAPSSTQQHPCAHSCIFPAHCPLRTLRPRFAHLSTPSPKPGRRPAGGGGFGGGVAPHPWGAPAPGSGRPQPPGIGRSAWAQPPARTRLLSLLSAEFPSRCSGNAREGGWRRRPPPPAGPPC